MMSLLRRSVPLTLLTVAVLLLPGCGKGEKTEESKSPSAGKSGDAKSPAGKKPGGGMANGAGPRRQLKDPQAQVYAALDHAKKLLDQDKIADYMRLYEPLAALQMYRYSGDRGGLEATAKRIAKSGEYKKMQLLQINMLRTMKPEFRNSNYLAVFTIKSPKQSIKSKGGELTKAANEKVLVTGYGEDLKTAIKKAIADLEKGDVAAYLKNMLPVIELQLNDVNELAKRIQAGKSKQKSTPSATDRIIADLKAVEKLTPKMEDGGNVAVFQKPFAGPKELANGSKAMQTIKFQKSNGHWRLYDNTTAMRNEALKMERVIAAATTKIYMERLGRNWRFAADPDARKRGRGDGYSRKKTFDSGPNVISEEKKDPSKTIEEKKIEKKR